MVKLVIMVGTAGSGKDWTIANKIIPLAPLNANVCVVNRDPIRERIIGDSKWSYQKEKGVYAEFIREIQNGLDREDSDIVVANATHLNDKARRKLLNSLRLDNVSSIEFAVVNKDLATCIRQNNQREGKAKIPVSAIVDQFNSFTLPKAKEYTARYHIRTAVRNY